MEFVHNNQDMHDYLVLNTYCTYHRITHEICVASQESLVGGYDPTLSDGR